MKRTLLAAATVLVAYGLGNASAADLGTRAAPVYKAPPPVTAPYSWTGFYVGASVGVGWRSGWSSTADPLRTAPLTGLSGLTFSSTQASGVIGGRHIAYTWPLNSSWLLASHSDSQRSSLRGSQTSTPLLRPPGAPLRPPSGPASASMTR